MQLCYCPVRPEPTKPLRRRTGQLLISRSPNAADVTPRSGVSCVPFPLSQRVGRNLGLVPGDNFQICLVDGSYLDVSIRIVLHVLNTAVDCNCP